MTINIGGKERKRKEAVEENQRVDEKNEELLDNR